MDSQSQQPAPFSGLYELPATLGSQPFSFSPSPDLLEDDLDDQLSDNDDDLDGNDPASGPKRKQRRAPSTAEKRANHNATERARRSSLNSRFMELARVLPTMNAKKRPSKNAIVSKSLDFVKTARAREQGLEAQNAALRAEVNELRAQLGMAPRPDRAPVSLAKQPPQQQPSPAPIVKQEAMPSPPVVAQPVQQQQQLAPSQGPYLPHDPVAAAAAYYQYLDAQRNAVLAAEARRGSSSSTEETSDSEASFVQTPPSTATFSPFYFEEPTAVSAAMAGLANFGAVAVGSPSEMFGCGPLAPVVTTAGAPVSGVPTSWTGNGLGFGPGATLSYSLYA